jgi:hypothetical protein
VQQTLDEFRVHYVLNLFNGVDDSFNTAVKPFVENLTSNVSALLAAGFAYAAAAAIPYERRSRRRSIGPPPGSRGVAATATTGSV